MKQTDDPRSLDELLTAIARDPDRARAADTAEAAMQRAGFPTRWPNWDDCALLEDLDADQRRVADAIAHRGDLGVGGFGMPSTPRFLRRWLGLDPPGALERRIAWTHEGRAVEWPLWYAWRRADDTLLEYGQGIPEAIRDALTPAEVIEAAGEASLESYGIETPYADRVDAVLHTHAAEAAPWARGFAEAVAAIRRPDAPRPRDEPAGYGRLGIYDFDALGILALLPLVRAGMAIDPRFDHIVPFAAKVERVREILSALPPERREAVVHRRLTTDWGPSGEKALNGFTSGLAVLDLAPSERVARILLGKLRNNRGHFKKRRDQHMATIESIAAREPGVAAALTRKGSAGTAKKTAKKATAKKAPATRPSRAK